MIDSTGRSPRARGSRGAELHPVGGVGAIPACAGEPVIWHKPDPMPRGDPRVRGGAWRWRSADCRLWGRSPRARGSPHPPKGPVFAGGAIPACAGEPGSPGMVTQITRGDPRVRGGAIPLVQRYGGDRGRSPRARGSQSVRLPPTAGSGAIPACAGEPAPGRHHGRRRGGDPRVRGGAYMTLQTGSTVAGRSPRARGSLVRRADPPERAGAIPACAGEPQTTRFWSQRAWGDPRVRGGAILLLPVPTSATGRSPRARGSRPRPRPGPLRLRAIPACAGEPRRSRTTSPSSRGDPRVRGGAVIHREGERLTQGRSPRARGSPRRAVRQGPGGGAIPACAGEPAALGPVPTRPRGDPRVRGGASTVSASSPSVRGRSPRARGSLV